jgi:hypothetical protein
MTFNTNYMNYRNLFDPPIPRDEMTDPKCSCAKSRAKQSNEDDELDKEGGQSNEREEDVQSHQWPTRESQLAIY